jgi:hypothetical protein
MFYMARYRKSFDNAVDGARSLSVVIIFVMFLTSVTFIVA